MAEVDGGDIVIRIRGDASDLEDAVARSQGAISGLENGADDAADVLGDMGSAAKKTKVDLKSMSSEGIGAVAAGLSAVNPQAGALVGLFGQLRVVSGPLALAIGAVAAALAIFEQNQRELDRQREISEAVADSLREVELRLRDAYEDNSVALGKLSRAELDVLRVRRAQFQENLPAVKAMNEQLSEQVKRVEMAKGAVEDLNPAQRNFAQLNEVLTKGLADESAELLRLQTLRDNTVAQMKAITTAKIEDIHLSHQQAAAEARCCGHVLHGHPERAVGNHQRRSQRGHR
jgi:type II secretory pathway component PulM